jgi:hypothetical protein
VWPDTTSDSRHLSNADRGLPISDSKQGKPDARLALPVWLNASVRSPTCGTTHPSLSLLRGIKATDRSKLPPLFIVFPTPRYASAAPSLPASRRSAPPFGDSSRVANSRGCVVVLPRNHDHRPPTSSSRSDHATATRHQW